MPETFEVHQITVQLNGSGVAGTALIPLLLADPVSTGDGGLTVIGAYFTAGALTGVGTAYKMALVHGGYRGTVLGGTIAAQIGGTASVFAADSVYPWTIITTSDINRLAAGDSLSIQKIADGVNMSPSGVVNIQFLKGR